MKRFLFFISALAALSLSGSCSREVADVSQEGEVINATFNVSLPGDIATKAISDGALADELKFIAFDENGRQIAGLDQTVAVKDKKATVSAKLIRGVQYTFAFWAQKTDQYAVSYFGNDAEHPYIVITTEQLPKMMNSDDYDAFFGTLSLKKDADFEEDVILTRPFAQINLAVDEDDVEAAVANGLDMATATSSFAFERQDGLKNQLQLFDGAVARTEDFTGSFTCNAAAVPGDFITRGNERYNRLAMLYVLAPADPNETATLDLSVAVNAVQNGNIPVAITRDIANVPVKKNFRTNIIGKLFSIDGKFTVTLSEGFAEPDNTVDIDTPAPVLYDVVFDDCSNGKVEKSQPNDPSSYEENAPVTVKVTPDDEYEIETVTYLAEGSQVPKALTPMPAFGMYTFNMPAANVTVSATFKPVTYTVTLATGLNGGSIEFAPGMTGNTFAKQATVSLLVSAESGHKVESVYYIEDVDTQAIHHDIPLDATSGYYQFGMPAKNVTVYATFPTANDGTQAHPFTVAEALDAVANLTWTSSTDYQKVGPYYIAGKISKITGQYATSGTYGNATFNISEDGSETNELVCFRILYLGNEKFKTGQTDIVEGDDVIIYGELQNYQGKTPETVQNSANLYSVNGFTEALEAPVITGAVPGSTETTTVIPAGTDTATGSLNITITAETGATIYYTVDGSEPTINSTQYSAPFEITAACTVKALAILNGKLPATASQAFTKASGTTPGGDLVAEMGQTALAAAADGGASVSMDSVISFENSSSYTDPVTELRVYKNKTLVISAASGYTLKKIEFTCTANGNTKQGPGCWGTGAPDGYTFESAGKNGTWEGSAQSVAFTAKDNQVRIANMKVTYVKD